MSKKTLKPLQQIFAIQYDYGYRYLDRCGDAMIILEQALPSISNNSVWMPEEAQPNGARMKCPDLDLTLVFDTGRLCLDQNPMEKQCPFIQTTVYAFKTIASKFEINTLNRFGYRLISILPLDSVEQARALSVKKILQDSSLACEQDDMKAKNCEIFISRENQDGSRGLHLRVEPVHKIEAPMVIDERLRKPPHTMKEKQKEALIEQLRRQKQRTQDPLAGLIIDIDYWWLHPKEPAFEEFFKDAENQITELTKSFLGDGK